MCKWGLKFFFDDFLQDFFPAARIHVKNMSEPEFLKIWIFYLWFTYNIRQYEARCIFSFPKQNKIFDFASTNKSLCAVVCKAKKYLLFSQAKENI